MFLQVFSDRYPCVNEIIILCNAELGFWGFVAQLQDTKIIGVGMVKAGPKTVEIVDQGR